jgi:hypothetical protein
VFGPHKIIASVAERQYGVFSQKQAVDKGFSRTAIQQRVADGRWRRVRSGVYAIAGVPKTFEGSLASAVLQIGDAFASHRTAAVLFALDGVRPLMRPELIVFDRRGISSRDLIVHRPRVWLSTDASSVRAIPTTSVARTLFDLAAVCRPREVEVAFDDLRRQLVSIEEMSARFEQVRRQGVRGLRTIARLVGDRAVNELEDSELEATPTA